MNNRLLRLRIPRTLRPTPARVVVGRLRYCGNAEIMAMDLLYLSLHSSGLEASRKCVKWHLFRLELGLTLRRRHGPVVAFFACRGMNLYAHTLDRVSKCYTLGQRMKSPHACLLDRTKKRLTRDGSASVSEHYDYALSLL